MPDTFLFYDLETFGQDPRRTRIAQFAAVRTDAQLQVVEEPASFFVRPARSPESARSGSTPGVRSP